VEEWRYISFSKYDAFENMAIDEAVLRVNQQKEISPTLRFYGWKSPSVSLGYFQNVRDEVNVEFCHDMGIHIVRRPTGGKAVLHEKDLTYSVVARENNSLFPHGLLGTYRVISECIAAGLAKLGIKADLLKEGRSTGALELEALCFSIPSQYELLVNGKKICGSAQMRSKGVFLQHGSILMEFDPAQTYSVIAKSDVDITRQKEKLKKQVTSVHETANIKTDYTSLCQILASSFEEFLGIRLVEGKLTPEEETIKEHLLHHKYMDSRWNMEGKAIEWIFKE